MSLNENNLYENDALENDTVEEITESVEKSTDNEKAPKETKKKKSKFVSFLSSRKAKRGGIAVLLTLIFVAMLIVVNIISTVLVARFPALSSDLTSNSAFEIQQETKDYLKTLEEDITITFFTPKEEVAVKGSYYVQAESLLKEMDQYGDTVSLKYLELATNPTFVQKYPDVNWTNASYFALVESGDDYICLTEDDVFSYDEQYLQYYNQKVINGQNVEQSVLTAMLTVTSDKQVKVGVVSDVNAIACEDLTKMLKNNAYAVEEISLLSGQIADDIQFIILFAPSADLTEASVDALDNWLADNSENSKGLLYVPIDNKNVETPNLDLFLEEWDIAVSDNYILEQDMNYMVQSQNPQITSLFDYSDADTIFTADFDEKDIRVLMPYCLSIDILNENTVVPLLVSSSSACEFPLDPPEDLDINELEMKLLNGAVASVRTAETTSSTVFVVGSYEAFSNSALSVSSYANSDYFMNLFNTVADKEDVGITVEGKNVENPELGITTTGQAVLFAIMFVAIIPLFVLVVGLVMWIIRRNR